jgi:hypothetical protein
MVASASAAAPAQNSSWADKMFKGATTHDFGSVPRGAQLFHRFTITNIYAVRLEILNVRSSCGCATVTPSTRALEPRQTGTIEVSMDARRFTGPKTVSVYITVGPEFTSTATLQLSANSRADVVLNPGEINFGVVSQGQTPAQTIDVEYAGVVDWRVNEVVQSAAPLDVSFEELYRRPGQVGYQVRVKLKPDAPAGMLKHEVLLKTNDPAGQLVPILVEAMVQAPLTVAPAAFNAGTVKVGETRTQKVIVKGNKPFRVLAVEGLGDHIQADLPTATHSLHVVTLKVQPQKAGDLRRQLLIKTDLAPEAPLTVTVEGNAVP